MASRSSGRSHVPAYSNTNANKQTHNETCDYLYERQAGQSTTESNNNHGDCGIPSCAVAVLQRRLVGHITKIETLHACNIIIHCLSVKAQELVRKSDLIANSYVIVRQHPQASPLSGNIGRVEL